MSTFKAATLAFGALGILSVSVLPAFAQEPLQVVDPVLKEVEEAAADPIGKVEETVTEPTGPVEEVVEAVEQTTEDTVAQVKEGAGEVIDTTLSGQEPAPGEPVSPSPQGRSGPTEPADGPVASDNEGSAKRSDRVLSQDAQRKERNGSGNSTTLEPQVPRAFSLAPSEIAPQAAWAVPLPSERSPLTPGEAAERLAFPIAMTALVVLFLVLQGRLDRRDPKLSFDAHLSGDSLSFE